MGSGTPPAERKPAVGEAKPQKSGGGGFLENLQRIRGDYLS
jgi:hypothetical protein